MKKDISDRAPVLIQSMRLDRDFVALDQFFGQLLGTTTVVLAFFGRVYTVQPDPFRVIVVEDVKSVAIWDSHNRPENSAL